MKEKLMTRGIATIVILLLAFLLNWLFLPSWTIHSNGLWGYLSVISLLATAVYAIAEYLKADKCYIFSNVSLIILLIIIVIWGASALLSSTIFNAKKYSNLIEVEKSNFQEDFKPISAEALITLDMETAQQLGSRAIGSLENISRYELNKEYNLIRFNGDFYRVTPLDYSGTFKAIINSRKGLPAYVKIDACKNQAKMIELENEMKYSPKAFGKYNLKRHLRKKFLNCILGKEQFEIDNSGNPYYIVPVMKTNIGLLGGKTAKSFIVVNAVSGECKEYTPDELPDWVDHAYSLENLMNLAEYHYGLKQGFWASIVDGSGVYNTSYEYSDSNDHFDGYSSIVINGEIHFLTGVVSASNDESMIGFVTASPKTGTFKFYECVGAEESSGMSSAEALVQNFGYSASQPIVVNVDGHETYFIMLKDKTLNNKGFAFVNIRDYTKAVQAETIEESLNLYRKKMGIADSENEEKPKEEDTTEGKIAELYEAIKSGSTNYFFRLEGNEVLFVSPIENNQKQVEMKVGDTVNLTYSGTEEDGVGLVSKITIKK